MSIVALFSGAFCGAEVIADRLVAETGYVLYTDETIITRAATLSGLPPAQLNRCFSAKPSVFNPFTREWERCLAWLKLALAEQCRETRWVLHGFAVHLLPPSIKHVLRVCLIADAEHRIQAVDAVQHSGRFHAAQRINADDRERAAWVRALRDSEDPWDASLYDMVLPTHALDARRAVDLITQGLASDAVQPTDLSRRAAADFLKAARIESALAAMGHVVAVEVMRNGLQLRIDRPVLMIDRLESELRQALDAMNISDTITVTIQPNTNARDLYRRYTEEKPSKVLLVDDEREFVQTLSERLGMRDIGSAVAFDGERALEMVSEEHPEVILLDLQMPGIDGMEVLQRVKATHPEIEVIILTGHGTDAHRAECMRLGAFAYLEKPVDIEVLSDTLKQANEHMLQNRANRKP